MTGYVDAAWHQDLNRNSVYDAPRLRAYDATNGFVLHAAHLAVAHSFGPEASAFISVDFGSDAAINSFNYAPSASPAASPNANDTTGTPAVATGPHPINGGIPVDVREAYAKWTPGDFTLQAGKFVTMNGIEVVDGPLNPTITRGFLYWLAEPVGHTGAKINYALMEGKAHVGLGLVNGWDRLYDNNNGKTLLFNADVAPDPMFHAQISGSYGPERTSTGTGDEGDPRLTVDLTGAVVLDSLALNFQGLIGSEKFKGNPVADSDSWLGFGIQPVYTKDAFSLGARLEYFSDKHGTRITGAPPAGLEKVSLLNFTITPGYMLSKSFTLRAEFRVDDCLGAKDASGNDVKKIFQGGSIDPATGLREGKATQMTYAIGATYAF